MLQATEYYTIASYGGKERVSDYQAGISCLQDQGFTIRAIVSDALSGIKEAFPGDSLSVLSVSPASANKTFAHH